MTKSGGKAIYYVVQTVESALHTPQCGINTVIIAVGRVRANLGNGPGIGEWFIPQSTSHPSSKLVTAKYPK